MPSTPDSKEWRSTKPMGTRFNYRHELQLRSWLFPRDNLRLRENKQTPDSTSIRMTCAGYGTFHMLGAKIRRIDRHIECSRYPSYRTTRNKINYSTDNLAFDKHKLT